MKTRSKQKRTKTEVAKKTPQKNLITTPNTRWGMGSLTDQSALTSNSEREKEANKDFLHVAIDKIGA